MRAMMSLITLPPGPMTFLMNSGRIMMVVMRGAYWLISVRGASSAFSISPRMCSRPWRACSSALDHDLGGEAGDLDVHLDAR